MPSTMLNGAFLGKKVFIQEYRTECEKKILVFKEQHSAQPIELSFCFVSKTTKQKDEDVCWQGEYLEV